MITDSHRLWLVTTTGLLALLLALGTASAQESTSAPLAKQLAQALDQAKLTTIAAKDPASKDTYVAAMYFPGSQLLVVSARYSVPVLLDAKLTERKFMDVYIDLNSASIPDSKVFVSDLKADGLQPRPGQDEPFDTYEQGGTQATFDRNWKDRNLTEDDYMKQFADADQRYAKMLTVLLAELKKK
jgi:hypothetical protein